MDRLSIFISMLTGAVATGVIAVTVMSLGYYNWYAIGGAAVAGALLAWPLAYAISRRIKTQDPGWEPSHAPGKHSPIPSVNAPEV